MPGYGPFLPDCQLPSPRLPYALHDLLRYVSVSSSLSYPFGATSSPFGVDTSSVYTSSVAGPDSEDADRARVRHIQGLMSALSAGMLVYAACVEMLAADFVMDAMMWRAPVRRQAMALASLLAGVAAMASVGH